MPWTDGPGPLPARSVTELLELVDAKAKAGRRRAQCRVVTVLCAVVVVGLASVMSIRAGNGDRRSPLHLADPASTTTSAVTQPSTTASAATQPPSTRTAAASLTPLPGAGCRNSTNPECGPFTWDPAPDANQPLTVNVTYAPASPRAGEEVTFTVVVEDPDARVMRNLNTRRDYGDGVVDEAPPSPASCGQAFGPWTPPDKMPDRFVTTFRHVYKRAGTYTASYSFESTSGCVGGDPYGSGATGSVTVNVAP